MTKDELLAAMEQGYRDWTALIEQVGLDRMTMPGVAGEWSVKDIVSHVGWYEWWAAEWIRTRDWPKLPPHLDFEDTDARNDAYFAEKRDTPLDEVLRDARAAHEDLIAAVAGLSDAEFADQTLLGMPDDPAWRVAQWIPESSHRHYGQHAPDIRRWLESN